MAHKALPYYLTPGSNLTIHHVEYGRLLVTVLPFSASSRSTAHAILVQLVRAPLGCAMQPDTPYIVKIFDPRFMRGKGVPWVPAHEAAAAPVHGGDIVFNPARPPSMRYVDYEEDAVAWEAAKFQSVAWQHHNECNAYRHLAAVQGSAVPRFFGAGRLDLAGTTPERAVQPFVLFLQYIQDAVSLDAIDPRRLTEPLMRAVMESGERLKCHGVIHTDYNPANFLLVLAHAPTRVVSIDFAESWTRDGFKDDEDWGGALREWNLVHDRRVALNEKFRALALSVPDIVALPHHG